MLHVILYQPEIPPNTGNVIRLCANAGAALHLVKPLGFHLGDARLRRAGLDYHDLAHVTLHADWPAYLESAGGRRTWAFSTRGTRPYSEADFRDGDGLLFGPESRGLPQRVLDAFPAERRLRVPMVEHSRSLNLSNTVAIALFEAWRQLGFKALHE